MNRRIFVTGGTGFVGNKLIQLLRDKGALVTAAVRRQADWSSPPVFLFDQLSADQYWTDGVTEHEVVIHCAARVHVMDDQSPDPLAEFRRINVDGTLNLARQAAAAGVKRFIFISSIKVNGEGTVPGRPYTAFDSPAPQDPYGISKMEAEQGLRQIAQQTGMELVIIRPVLVYGPGVKANFRSMMSWLSKGVPLPFGGINNKRSLVYLDNLVDLIVTCIDHPAAAGQTLLVSDGEDLSTSEILRRLGGALGKPVRLIPLPTPVLMWAAGLLGKREEMRRLHGSLQVDICHTCAVLNWTPPVSVNKGFRAAAVAYLTE